MIPERHSAAVIAHVCMVHGSVGDYSKMFLQKLRRSNYVTPKNYLDFISTYANLLEDKDQYILGNREHKVGEISKGLGFPATAVLYCSGICGFFVCVRDCKVVSLCPSRGVPAQCKRLEGGLDKLKEASVQLAELNIKLAEQKVVLAEKSSACEILLQEIATNTTVGQCSQHSIRLSSNVTLSIYPIPYLVHYL